MSSHILSHPQAIFGTAFGYHLLQLGDTKDFEAMVGVSHVIHGKDGPNLIPQYFVGSMMLVSLMEVIFD